MHPRSISAGTVMVRGHSVQSRTGGPDTRRTSDPVATRTGCPVDASKIRTGCSVRAREYTGVEPMSQVETDPLGRTRIMSTSQVETVPLGRTIGGGANQADGLEGLNGNVLDLGPADRLGRSPWPGDSVSAVYPSPPNDIPSVTTSARANNGTDIIKDGPVATLKEAKGSLPS